MTEEPADELAVRRDDVNEAIFKGQTLDNDLVLNVFDGTEDGRPHLERMVIAAQLRYVQAVNRTKIPTNPTERAKVLTALVALQRELRTTRMGEPEKDRQKPDQALATVTALREAAKKARAKVSGT